MRSLALALAAAVFGSVLSSTFATADEPTEPPVGAAVCTNTGGLANAKRFAEVMNEHLAAGRARILTTGENGFIVCGW